MIHKINVSESVLKPGMNWIELKDHGISFQEGDILEVSIQATAEPLEIRAMHFAIPKGVVPTYVQIPVPFPLPEEVEYEEEA